MERQMDTKYLKYIVLGLNIAYFAMMAWLLPMGFEENDDIMMAMIANGTYSGTPDFHLVYINVIYGAVLAALYSLTTAVEWYTVSFAVLHILSMSAIAYCILTTPNRAQWEKVIWLVVLYILWARIIIALQFTTTAGLVCLAGCVLLLRGSWQARWSGVALVVIAALIRFYAAGLVGVLMAPIILYTYRFEWRRYIPLAAMLALVVTCRVANHAVYDYDSEWRNYRQYNQLRARLNDNPNAYKMTSGQLPAGVDAMDYQLLLRFIPDAEQINLPVMRQLSVMVGKVPFGQRWHNLQRLEKYGVEMCILTALFVLMLLTTGNKSKYLFLIFYALFVAVLVVQVSLDGFLKNRVFLCMLLPLLVTDFMLLPDTTGRKRRWGIGLAMAVLSGWYAYQIYEERIVAEHNRYVWNQLQVPVLDYMPEGAYVTTIGTSMMVEAMNPWHVWPYNYRKYILGWMTFSPLNKEIGHSYRALLRDEVYVFTDVNYVQERTALQRVCEQIDKHYAIPTEIHWRSRNGKYALVKVKIKH